ncbi:enoyl-CoA hydratase/isomerase family protein [Chloroflexota bacterium]
MNNYSTIRYEKDGLLSMIVLNRPESMNALNEETIKEMNEALDDVEGDASIRVLIFTGGERTFCSGVDLKVTWTSDIAGALNKLYARIETLPKPTIAAINGYAVGGGLELALCCDFRIAAKATSLGTPEVKVGTIPTGGATFRLPCLIGESRAKELMLIGDLISGMEAYNFGLVNRVTEGNAIDEAKKLALVLTERPPLSLKAVKESVHTASHFDVDSGIRSVIEISEALRKTEDYQEGRSAFREKRKPVWKGK